MLDWNETFEMYQESAVALYGLGTETEKALKELEEKFHIVGLLDSFREDGCLYGQRIISLDECIRAEVRLIIVVARPGSCRAIAKRIFTFCRNNGIDLIDIRGKDLCLKTRVTYYFKDVNGTAKNELVRLAGGHTVISVDLFDTLIARQALFSADVIELTEYRLRKKGIEIQDFVEKRLKYEKELSKTSSPYLEEIYERVLEHTSEEITAKELAELEWAVDYDLIVPRLDMVELVSEFYRQGKAVYIITDTYYTKCRILKMLEKCGIKDYTDLLVSCEYQTGKTQGLFQTFREKIGGGKGLHIGDDLYADIECAGRAGLSSCHIFSSLDLLELAGYLGLQAKCGHLLIRLKAGMFAARLFNSPFQFETQEKAISIKTSADIGFLFMAPMICDFVVWFREKVRERKLKNILFSARDGYLIKKLYDMLNGFGEFQKPEASGVYFMTSRMAAIRAGIEDEDDIGYVAGMKFSGTLRRQLWERFGIDAGEDDIEEKTIFDYAQQIKENAAEHKKRYQRYVSSLPIQEGDVAFFDFVAKGTSQMFVSRWMEHHLKGLYFLQLEKDFMQDKNLDIEAFYSEGGETAIYDDYYILETVLTSPEPSFLEFDRNGTACFADETRTDRDMNCFLQIQEGIEEYFRRYLQICPDPAMGIEKETDELLLKMIHKVAILDQDFLNIKVEDRFFNRMTDITDLI